MTDAPFVHSAAFRWRRFLNWFPLGLTYAFLYMGRYNLTVAKNALGELMTKEDFGIIFGAGTFTYAFAFVVNGPLTDKIGGKKAMLIAAGGTLLANLAMGAYISSLVGGEVRGDTTDLRLFFSILYAANMYFQSFGAVAIVKVNAHWFHVRERGGFSGIFGTMISSGIFFAFTVNGWILDLFEGGSRIAASQWVFYAPAALLAIMFVIESVLLKDKPSDAGHADFDTGDAQTEDESSGKVGLFTIVKKVLTNPIILTVALIEFCTGVLRQGVMHWYPIYAKEVLALPSDHYMREGSWSAWYLIVLCFVVAAISFVIAARKGTSRPYLFYMLGGLAFLAPFLSAGWGGILMVAGVIGGNVAGWVSDLVFQSRRAPAAGFFYLTVTLAAIAMYFTLGGTTRAVGWTEMKTEDRDGGTYDRFEPGDEVVAVAGVTRIEQWRDVQRAIACAPATCMASRWDPRACMCTSEGGVAAATARDVTDLAIPATVIRDGERRELRLMDPSPEMRAGDSRTIKAGPVLTLSPLWLGIAVFFISLAVIGTHGLLSGTATMDFGGRRGAATAVGMIDGFVYLGTGVQSVALGYLTTQSWSYWPPFLIPFGVIGLVLLLRIWHVVPRKKSGGGH